MTYEIKEIEVLNPITNEVELHIVIDKGNGEMAGMSKAVWDEQQKAAELGGTL